MNLLCLINSRWVSGSLIITKSFQIQVSSFILVNSNPLCACHDQCDIKILCKTETLWGRIAFWACHFGVQTYDVAFSAFGVMWDSKIPVISGLAVAGPGWKEIILKSCQSCKRELSCKCTYIFLLFIGHPYLPGDLENVFSWTHHCFQQYWGFVTKEEDVDNVDSEVSAIIFQLFLSHSILLCYDCYLVS